MSINFPVVSTRKVHDDSGREWSVRQISEGKTSAYLNPKVHRPIVEFVPGSGGARLYAAIEPSMPPHLSDLTDRQVLELLASAKPH